MPAFEWIKWYPDGPQAANPHGWLTCNVIDNAQMIVMDCDVATIQAQHNLNLGQVHSTSAKWAKYSPNVTDYLVPPAIIEVAGGSPQGGATKQSPTNGWDDNRVGVYFGQKASFTARTPTRALPTQTPKPHPPPPRLKKKTNNAGAIVGGAVGGALVLLIAATLAWFCVRKHKRNKKTQPSPPPGGLMPSAPSTNQHMTAEKHSVVGSVNSTSRVGSSSYQNPDSIHHASASTTPPPMQPAYPYYQPAPGQQHPPMAYYPYPPQSYYHPAHGSSPMPYYYPPSDANRPEVGRVHSHEMPTVASPELKEVHQPKPVRADVANE